VEIKNGVIDVSGITDVSGDVTLIKGYTDTEVLAIKVETDKMPATITKIDNLETKTTLASKNLASNTSIAHILGNKEDDESGTSLYAKVYILEKHNHSRSNTYPYLGNAIPVVGGSGVWVLGNKVEIIPTATNDIQTMTIIHAADGPGTLTIFIDDKKYQIAVAMGNENAVAAEIRASVLFEGYTITGADAAVIFTRSGKRAVATLANAGGTGVTVTIVHTNAGVGVGDPFDLHFFTPSIPTATTTYQVIFWAGLAGYEERIATKRLVKASAQDTLEPISIMTPLLSAGTRICSSLATLAGGPDTISLGLEYHSY